MALPGCEAKERERFAPSVQSLRFDSCFPHLSKRAQWFQLRVIPAYTNYISNQSTSTNFLCCELFPQFEPDLIEIKESDEKWKKFAPSPIKPHNIINSFRLRCFGLCLKPAHNALLSSAWWQTYRVRWLMGLKNWWGCDHWSPQHLFCQRTLLPFFQLCYFRNWNSFTRWTSRLRCALGWRVWSPPPASLPH